MSELAQILLWLFVASLLIALVKGGWTGQGGVSDWFKAKFLGQVSS